jgi:uncharacterized membrane protein
MPASQTADRTAGSGVDGATLGALAHLYRAEVYQSTQWRTRLDHTTNWAVVTTGIALSATFSGVNASPLPMVLVGLLVVVFLIFEARRYRYYNLFRARARKFETEFYVPLLGGGHPSLGEAWSTELADDYRIQHYRVSYLRAIGRRLRKNYSFILGVQAIAYYGKLFIHPTPLTSLPQVVERAAIGPINGGLVMLAGVAFHLSWIMLAAVTWRMDQQDRHPMDSSHD